MSDKFIQIKDGSDKAFPEAGFYTDYSGTNNFYCTKFADGTMIQWGYYELKSGSLSQIGSSGIYSIKFDVTYPVSFISTYGARGYATARYSTGYVVPAGVLCTSTAMTIMAYDFYPRTYSSSYPLKVYWTVIGRWK